MISYLEAVFYLKKKKSFKVCELCFWEGGREGALNLILDINNDCLQLLLDRGSPDSSLVNVCD